MKMRMFRNVSIIALCAAMLAGCSAKAPDVNDKGEATEATEAQRDVEVEITEGRKDWSLDDGTVYFAATDQLVQVSIINNAEAEEKINAALKKRSDDFYAEAATEAEYAKETYEIMKEDNAVDDYFPYEESATVQRADDAVISLSFSTYAFLGGAHGSTVIDSITFDAKSGETLAISDLSDDEAALKEAALSYIKNDCETKWKDALFEDYEETLPKMVDDGTWYLTYGGLTFVAQQYDIAPYAAGIIYFDIPYSSLPMMKSEYVYSGENVDIQPIAQRVEYTEPMKDMEYNAEFEPSSFDTDKITVDFYDYDRYEKSDIQKLRVGDRIKVLDTEIYISKCNKSNGFIEINEGYYPEGVYLTEEDDYYRTLTDDDYPLYYYVCTQQLPISKSVVIEDYATVEEYGSDAVVSGFNDLPKAFTPTEYGVWTAYNTTITVKDAEITKIVRRWTP